MKEKIVCIVKSIIPNEDFDGKQLVDEGILDSVTLIAVISELIEEFHIEIPYEEITPENFNTIDSIEQLVKRYV